MGLREPDQPQWGQIPLNCVMVGVEAWRYREEAGDRDTYRFALRYAELIP